MGDQRGAAGAALPRRRGALGAGRLRADALGHAAALPARARRGAREAHRARPADGRGAAALRVVDWRGSRWQSRGDRARDGDGLSADALAGSEPVPPRSGRAPLRAVDDRCQRRAARARGRRQTSRTASCCANCAPGCQQRCGQSRRGWRALPSPPYPSSSTRKTSRSRCACVTDRWWRRATASWRAGGCATCSAAWRRSGRLWYAWTCGSTPRGTRRR